MWELREVLTWEAERLRRHGEGLSLLVGAVLEAAEPERTEALGLLRRVLELRPQRPALRKLSERTVELLDHPEVELRWMGAQLLDAGMTPAAIPGLRRGLGAGDAKLRQACVAALRSTELGPEELGEHLDSERAEEREAALELLRHPLPEALRPKLRRLLVDSRAQVRHLAAEWLGVDREAPEAWAVTLEAVRAGQSGERRAKAVQRLRSFGLRPEAVPVLLEGLSQDPDEWVRESIAEVLEALAPAQREVAEALLEALRDAYVGVGERAAQSLGRRGATTEAVVPRLLTALEDSSLSEHVRGEVGLTLARLEERAVVPVLLRLLERPNDSFRERGDEVTGLGTEPWLKLQVVRALGKLGPLAVDAVPVLLASLRTGAVERQVQDAEALERIGTVRAELEEALGEVLLGVSSGWKAAQLRAVLARLKPEREASLRELARALEAEEEPLRLLARTHLWRAVGDRPEIIERLQAFTRKEDPALRRAAGEALRVLGRPTVESLERLALRLESADEGEREAAIAELRTLASRAGALLGELTKRLSRLGPEARAAVLSVLGPLSGGRLEAVLRAALTAGLEDAEARVREAALWALSDFSEVDAETRRLAEARLEDPESQVRELAQTVLRTRGGAELDPAPPANEPTTQASRALLRFTFALQEVLRDGEGNRVFSPLSLFTLLAMVMRGARGHTEAALGRALHWPEEPSRLAEALRTLGGKLHPPAPQNASPHIKEEGAALVSANGFWGQEGHALRAEFLEELAEQFGVKPRRVDFAGAPEAASEVINAWAREHTQGRIPALFSPGALPPQTRYVMANAVYFRSRWAQPFYEDTREAPFHLLDGREVDVPMMSREGRFGYARGRGYQWVELPYQGGHASMGVLLPDAGFLDRMERLLTAEWLEQLLSSRTQEEFVLKLPRFDFQQNVDVTALAERLGLGALFEPDVDLTGMMPAREPFMGKLLHDASITVDEKGTEAAAVTRVYHIGGVPQEVVANRPFLFLIRHEATGAVLFLGRVVDPRGATCQ